MVAGEVGGVVGAGVGVGVGGGGGWGWGWWRRRDLNCLFHLSVENWYKLQMNLTLQWRHNGRDGVWNHQLTTVYSTVYSGTKKTTKLRVTGFVRGIHRWHGKCFHLMTSSWSTQTIIECGKILLIHSQTSMVQPFMFGNGWIILFHVSLCMWLIIHAYFQFNPC